VVNSSVYLISGMKKNAAGANDITNTVEVYNAVTNTWSDAPPIPVGLHHPNVATVNGKIYVLGGVAGPNRTGWETVGNTYRYDPDTKKWEELGKMPAEMERGSCIVGVRGKVIHLAGGIQIKPGTPRTTVDLVSTYDTESGKWTTSLPKLPEVRDHAVGGIVNDVYYVVGGRVTAQTAVRGTVFALNLASPNAKWVEKAKMPTPRGGIAGTSVGTKIYTFGGEGNPAPGTRGVFPNVESYDTARDVWEKETTMQTPRHGMGAVSIRDTIFLPGGGAAQGGSAGLDTNEAFYTGAC
jgi:N-acetylneuraminic acid mutarotase